MNNKERVLEYLKKYGSITAFEGFTSLRIVSVRDYISMLRRDGVAITSQWETSGGGKRFKVYYLDKSVDIM